MITPAEKLDLTGIKCPINSAKTLLKLETMTDGQILEIIIDDGEPILNVPPSLELEGHKIKATSQMPDGRYKLYVEKK